MRDNPAAPPDPVVRPSRNPGDEAAPGTAQTGEHICPVCGGSGIDDGAPCASCGGSGTIVAIVGDA